ncbi:TPA: DUF551 domain-containing protein [Citrobacter amalonaticus]|nr:DUF551 domain-containing protein [Citrobacter amalonaticus]
MTTITREQAQAVSDLKAGYTLGHADVAILKELARIALASLEAEPALYAAEETLAYANMGELHLTCLSEPMGDAVIPLYAAHPAQRTPDMTDFRPCPFCNSPVKWCGENSADPEDDHACHHIQCTNPECGADFDFTNTGDDLLPDDPETLDAMTAAECLQPLRNVCLNRFNSRAAMLHGSQAVSNRDELPVIGWLRSDYNSDDKRDPNAPLFMLGRNDPSETWGVKYIPLTGNSPVIPDGWVACSERMPETDFKVLANVKSTAVEYQCLAEVDENGRWWDEYGEQLPSPFVTHWQPLPAAPQQEAKNV